MDIDIRKPLNVYIWANKKDLQKIEVGYTQADPLEAEQCSKELMLLYPLSKTNLALEVAKTLARSFEVELVDNLQSRRETVERNQYLSSATAFQESAIGSLRRFYQTVLKAKVNDFGTGDLADQLGSVDEDSALELIGRWVFDNAVRIWTTRTTFVRYPEVALDLLALETTGVAYDISYLNEEDRAVILNRRAAHAELVATKPAGSDSSEMDPKALLATVTLMGLASSAGYPLLDGGSRADARTSTLRH